MNDSQEDVNEENREAHQGDNGNFFPLTFREFICEILPKTQDKVEDTLRKVDDILSRCSKLVEIPPSRLYVLGDTHGNLALTLHAIKHLFRFRDVEQNEGHHSIFDKVVFLGDFIDRGPYSVENVNLLLSLKAHYPDRIILIRGNHETREISRRFDFYEKVLSRYGMRVFEFYTKIFSKLPLAILTWNHIFAVHGGIPEGLEKLSQLNGLEDEVDPENLITFQLLWNDPIEKDGWFFKNFRGTYSRRFGYQAFKHFVEKNDIHLVLRSHEPQKGGYRKYFSQDKEKGLSDKENVPELISLDSLSTKRKKYTHKVFILEKDGTYEIREVEFFSKEDPGKVLKGC